VAEDQRAAVLASVGPAEDVHAALAQARGTFSDLSEGTPVEVAGRPGALATSSRGALVAVDLDGLPGGDGQVLILYAWGFPEGTDMAAIAQPLAAQAVAAM
jgi:hypothetical protein